MTQNTPADLADVTSVQDGLHDQLTEELAQLNENIRQERWRLDRAATNITLANNRATALAAWLQANPRSTPRLDQANDEANGADQ